MIALLIKTLLARRLHAILQLLFTLDVPPFQTTSFAAKLVIYLTADGSGEP